MGQMCGRFFLRRRSRHGTQMAATAVTYGGRAGAQFAHHAYYKTGPAETTIA